MTIDKARKLKKGSGFRRIQLELSSRFGIDISYGAVVELGIAKSRRKRSAARYKNAVALACRRNVKRVSEENIDKHKSAAHYQIAHYLRDRVSQVEWLWFERDDHSKVRMNSSSTTNQHAVPTVCEGMGAVQHDYNDPSVCSSLYVTSIRAAPLADGREINVAVVKVDGLHPSSPSQHFADLYMLQENTDERCVALFRSSDGGYKSVMQIEVDGGTDEDPSRAETQCLLAELMLGGPKRRPEMRRRQVGASTRCSHSSPLNKVERLNGQETRGAAGFVAMTNVLSPGLTA